MKQTLFKTTLTLAMALTLLFALCSCGSKQATEEAEAAQAIAEALDVTDYSDPANWYKCESDGTYTVDTVFLYPTALWTCENEDGICDINDDMKTSVAGIYDMMASTFEGVTNMYVPYYRDFSMEKELEICEGGIPVLVEALRDSVAKDDVFAALDYYFENCNDGKPFILAGHSQGSIFARIVLEDYMADHPDYLERMVAAYPIGFGFPQSYFDKNTHLKAATGETDTGVIVTWNTEGPGATTPNALVEEDNCICINPLNWKTDDTYAGAELCTGARIDGQIIPNATDAQIDLTRHTLIATGSEDYLPVEAFGDKCLHGMDYPFFYTNIHDNAQKRIDAFFAEHPAQ